MLINREQLAALIPHAGSMCLLDGVERYDEQAIHCVSDTHRADTNPLRRNGMLGAIHLIEYGAQAMAVHGGLLAQRAGASAAPGLLTSVRELELQVARIDDIAGTLAVSAQRLVGGAEGWLYQFSVHAGTRLLARGRISVNTRAS